MQDEERRARRRVGMCQGHTQRGPALAYGVLDLNPPWESRTSPRITFTPTPGKKGAPPTRRPRPWSGCARSRRAAGDRSGDSFGRTTSEAEMPASLIRQPRKAGLLTRVSVFFLAG